MAKLSLDKIPARPVLVAHHKDGHEVKVGDTVTSFRGETATLVSLNRPASYGRSGKVSVRWDGREAFGSNEYYDGVFDLTVSVAE